jgi:hypothetical protein
VVSQAACYWLRVKTQPKQFCTHASNFQREDNTFIQIKVDDQFLTESEAIADAFVNHFKCSFNSSCPSVTSFYAVMSDFKYCRSQKGYEMA